MGGLNTSQDTRLGDGGLSTPLLKQNQPEFCRGINYSAFCQFVKAVSFLLFFHRIRTHYWAILDIFAIYIKSLSQEFCKRTNSNHHQMQKCTDIPVYRVEAEMQSRKRKH